jgi:hypothetical protein
VEIMADGQPILGVTGPPAFIQSTTGVQGNFEMVVPEGGRLVRYWRDNNAPGLPWHQGEYLLNEPPFSASGSTAVLGAGLLQSRQGNLEVVAWLHHQLPLLQGGGATDYLASFYRDAVTQKWYGPVVVIADGKPVENVSGP